MNKERRAKLEQAREIISEAIMDEQAAFDNLPDSFRDGDKGAQMEEFIGNMDEAVSQLTEVIES
ncbi:MAG: hypothetical protein WCH86_02265 [Kiritimatiellales bacterium]